MMRANGRWYFVLTVAIMFLLVPNVSSAVSNVWTSGSGTFVVPAGVTSIFVQVIGAGGAGAGGTNEGTGGGGGGGGYSEQTISVTPGQRISFSVGGQGIPSTSYGTPHCEPGADASGYAGGNSNFGSVVAYGGQGGQTGGTGGAGGWGSRMSGRSGVSMDRWNYNGGNGGASGHNVFVYGGTSYGVGSICSGYGWAYYGYCAAYSSVPAGSAPSVGGGGGGVGLNGTCDWSAAYVYYPGAGAGGYIRITYTPVVIVNGTINVSSNIASSWTITGPTTITGSGVSQSVSAPPGNYIITWNDVEWYNKFPTGQSLTLPSGGAITFNGTYTEVVSGTWVAPTCPSSPCGLSASNQSYVCSGGDWPYNGRCRAAQPAPMWCPGTAACVVPTGTWTAPSCPTACGTPASSPSYYCSGGNGLCSTNSPSTLSCPATTACPAPNLVSQNFSVTNAILKNNPLNFSADVSNTGNLPTPTSFKDNFSYRWGASGAWTDLPRITKGIINAGGTLYDSGSYTPTVPGTLYIQHCVDSDREIAESDENNCVSSGAITVSTPTCTGLVPGNASRCSSDDPLVNTPYSLIGSCSSFVGTNKCHYSCDAGYITSGSSCVPTKCNNDIDDDGDGLIDSNGTPSNPTNIDAGCSGIDDNDEYIAPELSVSKRTVASGGQVTLSWNLNENTGCTLRSGSRTFDTSVVTSSTTPIYARTTFTLSCTLGSDSETVDILPVGAES